MTHRFKHTLYSTILCWRFPFLKYYDTKDKFIQTSCWYYAVNPGWRRIALQMFEEIREALKRDNRQLSEFRIYDIKEKNGYLTVDCSGGFHDDTQKIVEKYEYISFRTCCVCGRPAYGYTDHHVWTLPYCRHCAPVNTPIYKFGTEEDKWYGVYSLNDKGLNPVYLNEKREETTK